MDDFGRSRPRGFNPPLDRSVWIWIIGAAVVSVAMTYWATSGRHSQVTANTIPAADEPQLVPPIPRRGLGPEECRGRCPFFFWTKVWEGPRTGLIATKQGARCRGSPQP